MNNGHWWKADRARVMGVVNVTPDSFSDGGRFIDPARAVAHARDLIAQGADILDIGGESTRPGAQPVSAEEECARIIPVIEALKDCGVPISVDTRRAATMRAAIAAGAAMINDVTALAGDEDSMKIVADSRLPVCLMHMQGEPQSMQDNPRYNNVVEDVIHFFDEKIALCEKNDIARERIIVDPGIGFGKNLEHNIALLRNVSQFGKWGCVILVGVSRKRFIGEIADVKNAADRDPGTIAASLQAVAQGARIVRVHNVGAMTQALKVAEALT
jgi:dihydropteroate synthase